MTDPPQGSYRTEHVGYLVEHLNWMRRCGRADRTIKARAQVLTWLAEFLGHDPSTATIEELEMWQNAMRSRDKLRWCTAMIRPYYRYLHQRGLRRDDPAALLAIPRPRRKLPRPIPDDRLMAAIAAAPRRILPWLLLAGWCGMRAGEVAGMHRRNIVLDARGTYWIRIVGKGEHERDIPVPGWVWEIIDPLMAPSGLCWRRQRGTGPVTAQHVSQYCNEYLHGEGIPDTLHSLRHRVATLVAEDTRDLRLVQDLLGHSDLSSLHVYTRVQNRRIAEAVEALPRPPLELLLRT
ncbi:tyrosine-type recombinase/integrase [Pseudonocardia sp. RS010]|uniref:tyrosine-type recombinase/integrase n=1 Tax=Pseudonocardia sp. RS010 TaxID=3385979 RepID=UPI0039A380CC